MPRFTIDLEVCGRTGMCYFERPDLFREGDDGFPLTLAADDTDELSDEELAEVLAICPTGAIVRATDTD